jgi:hemerythrin-like domain-containing protein
MKSTKLLMADHDIILNAIHVLDTMRTDIDHRKDVDFDDIRSLLTFLREFADGCHHVKEEAMLFPALIQAGLPLQDGPLAVLSHEHESGRALTAAMEEALDRNNKEDFVMYAVRYATLLREHIEKENSVLFDMADRTLTYEEDQNLADAFAQFETTHERPHDVIARLASKYLRLVA